MLVHLQQIVTTHVYICLVDEEEMIITHAMILSCAFTVICELETIIVGRTRVISVGAENNTETCVLMLLESMLASTRSIDAV